MRKSISGLTIVLLLIAGLIGPVAAFPFQQIGWQDLIKQVEFDDPFEALTMDQLLDLRSVARMRELETQGREAGEGTQRDVETAVRRLESADIDIDGLLARRATLTVDEPWANRKPVTQIVFIGKKGGINKEWIEKQLIG